MQLNPKCRLCGKVETITVNDTDYRLWKSGTLIQTAFPYLSAGQREILISGICGSCFDNLFPENDDE